MILTLLKVEIRPIITAFHVQTRFLCCKIDKGEV